jgi:hypothetical protein
MTPVNQELAALITGVGKLKMESGREIIITGVIIPGTFRIDTALAGNAA